MAKDKDVTGHVGEFAVPPELHKAEVLPLNAARHELGTAAVQAEQRNFFAESDTPPLKWATSFQMELPKNVELHRKMCKEVEASMSKRSVYLMFVERPGVLWYSFFHEAATYEEAHEQSLAYVQEIGQALQMPDGPVLLHEVGPHKTQEQVEADWIARGLLSPGADIIQLHQ